MDKRNYFPNSPFFLFESIIFVSVISVIIIIVNSRLSVISHNSQNPVFYFLFVFALSFILIVYYSNHVEIGNGFIKGPASSYFIIFSTRIPIKEAEYHFEEKFFRYVGMVKFLIIKHKFSNKKIHISCLAFTNETIEEIIQTLGDNH